MVRLAEEPDFPVISELRRQVHQIHVNGRSDIYKMPDDITEFDHSFHDVLEHDHYKLFVCEKNSAITGYALIRLVTVQNQCMKQDRFSYFIDEFCVAEDCRRQGIGTELMTSLREFARKDHASSVELDVWAFNESAEQFYRSLGMTTKHTFLELPLTP